MATLFIGVFEGSAEVAKGDPIQEITVAIGATSAQSAVISGSDRKRRTVRLFADANCFATWGSNPTAQSDGSDGRPLQSGSAEYFDIEVGHKIACIERV